ncbi:MAG: CotH kinase family protein [Clostridia bacterium]|nr:CotH kinase family protein [Clostridia bacterium]
MKTRMYFILSLLAVLLFTLALPALAEETREESALPQVSLVSAGEPGILSLREKSAERMATLTYRDQEKTFSWPVTVKLQGTSTLDYGKKNYTIKFYSDGTYAKKQKVTVCDAWGAHAKYCLKANYQDSTQARNVVTARLAGDMNKPYNIFPDAPNSGLVDGFPVEVFIDGEYWGLYTFNIPKGDWMFGMSGKNENHLVMEADNLYSDSIQFRQEASTVLDQDWTLAVGPDESAEEIAGAYEKLNRVIRFVMNSTDEEFRAHFSEYLNLDACLNYYCFAYYVNASDNMAKNLLLATLDGQVWYPSLYDLDTAFGLYFNGEGLYTPLNRIEYFQGGNSLLWTRFSALFPRELHERYFELRKTVLNEAYIMGLFEAFDAQIPTSAWAREREKWPDAPGREYGLDSIREHIQAREGFVDGVFSSMYHPETASDDPRLIFQLEAPYQGRPNGYWDTGLRLYDGDQDFTILLKIRTGQQEQSSKVILSNNNNDLNGLLVQCSGDGTDAYTIFFAGAHTYEAVYALDKDGCAYVTIRKQGDEYTFFGKTVTDYRQFVSPLSSEVDSTLLLGGQYHLHSDGAWSAVNNYTGVLEQCRVYGEALSTEEIEAIMGEMKSAK